MGCNLRINAVSGWCPAEGKAPWLASQGTLNMQTTYQIREGGGTLVVMVPLAEGLVVAADSRVTITPLHCDNVYKIAEPSNVERLAVTVTGYSLAWNFQNVPWTEVCKHIEQPGA